MTDAPEMDQSGARNLEDPAQPSRRSFLSVFCSACMAVGLAAGYGMFFILAGKFLFPSRGTQKTWVFVTSLEGFEVGHSLVYRAPAGQTISIARLSENGVAEDFVALSSVCPHLGCRVHWQAQNQQFFCPCHNGAFDPQGVATAGPPADARPPQSLARYPLMVENRRLFIEVPTSSFA